MSDGVPEFDMDALTSALSDDDFYAALGDLELRKEIPGAFGLGDTVIEKSVRAEVESVERAIRGAIRAGYDGVDVNRPMFGVGGPKPPEAFELKIEPWSRPEPDGANGYRTTRYTWDWFSDDELARLLTDDEFVAELSAALRSGRDE